MPILYGDTGKCSVGSLKTFTTTLATPREIVPSPAVTLPTTAPGTAQISFTIQQSDLPTTNYSCKYLAMIYLTGKCSAMGTASIITEPFKNGVSLGLTSSANVTLNYYWALTFWKWMDVTVGDTLDIKLSASMIDLTWDFAALHIFPTQPILTKPGVIVKDFNSTSGTIPAYVGIPLPNGITNGVTNTGVIYFYPSDTSTVTLSLGLNGNATPFISQSNPYFYKAQYGDTINALTTYSGATAKSRQWQAYFSQMSFREVFL